MGEEMRVEMGRHVVLDPVEHEDRIWIVGVLSKYIHKHVYNNIVTLTGQNKKRGRGRHGIALLPISRAIETNGGSITIERKHNRLGTDLTWGD